MSATDGIAARLAGEVARFEHGSRVPGWDDPVDLAKAPATVPDPATTAVPADLRAEIEAAMAKYPDFRSAALPALAAAQRVHGWCSPEAIDQVAAVMEVTPAYLQSVASFYDMLDTQPVGRHRVYVCTNISCQLNGGGALHDRLRAQTRGDDDFFVRPFECLGACDIAPMASVDGIYIGPIDLDEVPQLVDDVKAGRPPLPDKQLRRRLSADPAVNSQSWPQPDPQPGVADPRAASPKPPTSAGPLMPDEHTGPTANIEQPVDQPGPPDMDEA